MKALLGFLLLISTTLSANSGPGCPNGGDAFMADRKLPACRTKDNSIVLDDHTIHLFDIRKSYNPENVMVIYAHVTSDCKFPEVKNQQELINLYWRMNESSERACKKESMIKGRIRNKIEIKKVAEDRASMTIYLDDMKKVKHDLADQAAVVTLIKDRDVCKAQVTFSLPHKKLNLTCVFGEPVTWFGIPAPIEKVESLILFGTDENGNPIEKKYLRD
jgi:hypothetical protein